MFLPATRENPGPLFFLFSPMAITTLENLLRGAELFVRSARHAQRFTELIDDVLVGGCHAAAHGFLSDTRRALPVGIDVTAGELGAGRGMLAQLPLEVALGVGANDGRFARRRPFQVFLGAS